LAAKNKLESRTYGIDAENQSLINNPETLGKEIAKKTNFLQEKNKVIYFSQN